MSTPKFDLPDSKRGRVAKDPIWISGEITTAPEAAERLGMKEDSFSRKRRRIAARLPKGEQLTWEHFK